jgi:hypothetical protein
MLPPRVCLLGQAGIISMLIVFGNMPVDEAFAYVRRHPPATPEEFRDNGWFHSLAIISAQKPNENTTTKPNKLNHELQQTGNTQTKT